MTTVLLFLALINGTQARSCEQLRDRFYEQEEVKAVVQSRLQAEGPLDFFAYSVSEATLFFLHWTREDPEMRLTECFKELYVGILDANYRTLRRMLEEEGG